MRRSRVACLLVSLVVLAWTGSAGTAAGRVVCFGADGHVALEADAGDGTCGSRALPPAPVLSSAGGAESAAAWRSSHCGPCTDLAMPLGDAARNAPQAPPGAGAPAAAEQASLEGISLPGTEGWRRPADPSLLSLRTTHLLI